MLKIRPTCQHCNKPLPLDSNEARICSYECRFCVRSRPIRPSKNWKGDNFLVKTQREHPSNTKPLISKSSRPLPADSICSARTPLVKSRCVIDLVTPYPIDRAILAGCA
ncbi:MAG: DUF1272 domain-containing protein [Nitrospira sp.]|nr:DUF1272 domain-containing protein [Nitrospira sp.]